MKFGISGPPHFASPGPAFYGLAFLEARCLWDCPRLYPHTSLLLLGAQRQQGACGPRRVEGIWSPFFPIAEGFAESDRRKDSMAGTWSGSRVTAMIV